MNNTQRVNYIIFSANIQVFPSRRKQKGQNSQGSGQDWGQPWKNAAGPGLCRERFRGSDTRGG